MFNIYISLIYSGNEENVTQIIKNGFDINGKNQNELTALYLAVKMGECFLYNYRPYTIVSYLITQRVSSNQKFGFILYH